MAIFTGFAKNYQIKNLAKISHCMYILSCHFSMQLAVDVRIPELFGGVEGEAIFIGTMILLEIFILLANVL